MISLALVVVIMMNSVTPIYANSKLDTNFININEDFNKDADLDNDKEFIKLRYKSWMYSEVKVRYEKLPNNHEMKNPRNINDIIKSVTNEYKPVCEGEVLGMKEMTEKVRPEIPEGPASSSGYTSIYSAENHNISTSFSGKKRRSCIYNSLLI